MRGRKIRSEIAKYAKHAKDNSTDLLRLSTEENRSVLFEPIQLTKVANASGFWVFRSLKLPYE